MWYLAWLSPYQKIDISSAGSVTTVFWVKSHKEFCLAKAQAAALKDPSYEKVSAFAVGFRSGVIAIYKQSLANVSVLANVR